MSATATSNLEDIVSQHFFSALMGSLQMSSVSLSLGDDPVGQWSLIFQHFDQSLH